MLKHLLASAIVAATSLSISATTIKVWEGNTKLTGWSDKVSVSASEFVAASEGCQIVVNITVDMTLDPSINYTTLGVKTGADNWPELDGTEFKNPTGDSQAWDINAAAAEQLKSTGLIVQGQNIVVTSIDLISAADIDPNLLFEGNLVINGWNSGVEVSTSKVKAGDAVKYTFTSAGSQILVKNSSWANLLGTSKITDKDMETGSVIVGITNDVIANAGNKFFIQGDGGATITKAELVSNAFNPEGVITYGKRIPGSSVFTNLPEGTTKLAVVFEKTPSWAQICTSGWEALHSNDEATVTNNADGSVTMVFPITASDITAINNKSEFVINGDSSAGVLSVYIPGEESGIEAIEAADSDAPVEYFNLQGIRVENPENGIFVRRQGGKVSKVVIR